MDKAMCTRVMPLAFGSEFELNDDELGTYWTLFGTLQEIKVARYVEKELDHIFTTSDDEVNDNVKVALALSFYTYNAIAEFAFRNFPVMELWEFISRRGINIADAYQIAHNKNITWDFLHKILVSREPYPEVKDALILHLEPCLVTKEIASGIMEVREQANISLRIATIHARIAYELDDSIPDEWVERMFMQGEAND